MCGSEGDCERPEIVHQKYVALVKEPNMGNLEKDRNLHTTIAKA